MLSGDSNMVSLFSFSSTEEVITQIEPVSMRWYYVSESTWSNHSDPELA